MMKSEEGKERVAGSEHLARDGHKPVTRPVTFGAEAPQGNLEAGGGGDGSAYASMSDVLVSDGSLRRPSYGARKLAQHIQEPDERVSQKDCTDRATVSRCVSGVALTAASVAIAPLMYALVNFKDQEAGAVGQEQAKEAIITIGWSFVTVTAAFIADRLATLLQPRCGRADRGLRNCMRSLARALCCGDTGGARGLHQAGPLPIRDDGF